MVTFGTPPMKKLPWSSMTSGLVRNFLVLDTSFFGASFLEASWAVAIADYTYPQDPNARSAAILHLQVDALCSSDPVFKKQLEFFAEMDAKKRKRVKKMKRTSKKNEEFLLSPQEAQLKKDLKNMLEIQRLAWRLRS